MKEVIEVGLTQKAWFGHYVCAKIINSNVECEYESENIDDWKSS